MTNAASVKDRLRNYAVKNEKMLQEVLTVYGLERTIYRLSVSEYVGRFTLKGGIVLYALFDGEFQRITRDIDLLAKNLPNDAENMRKVFEKIFCIECDDALKYDLSTLEVRTITEFKEYPGVNVSIIAYLDRTKIPVSVDIGFSDVIYPDRAKMDFPVLLDMKAPEIYVYSIYSVIAEEFEAIVSLGTVNSRYKDFYDIYILASRYSIDALELKNAVRETFGHRGTNFDDIVAFTDAFEKDEIHLCRWEAFLKKKRALEKASFADVLRRIKNLLEPVVVSIQNETVFDAVWDYKEKSWKL